MTNNRPEIITKAGFREIVKQGVAEYFETSVSGDNAEKLAQQVKVGDKVTFDGKRCVIDYISHVIDHNGNAKSTYTLETYD